VLPLSKSNNLSKDLGMRHRAGIGMSEVSDAVIAIVSEETGSISVAQNGMLKRHLNTATFEKLLRSELMPEAETEKNSVSFGDRVRGFFKGKRHEAE
jgi:diadenylate cyclase